MKDQTLIAYEPYEQPHNYAQHSYIASADTLPFVFPFGAPRSYAEASRLNDHAKFRQLPCRTFISSGTCPYRERCDYLHDPRLMCNETKSKTRRKNKEDIVMDSLFWPVMPFPEVSRRLDNARQPHVIQEYHVPVPQNNEYRRHDQSIFSLWMHFVSFCHEVQTTSREARYGYRSHYGKSTSTFKHSGGHCKEIYNKFTGEKRLPVFHRLSMHGQIDESPIPRPIRDHRTSFLQSNMPTGGNIAAGSNLKIRRPLAVAVKNAALTNPRLFRETSAGNMAPRTPPQYRPLDAQGHDSSAFVPYVRKRPPVHGSLLQRQLSIPQTPPSKPSRAGVYVQDPSYKAYPTPGEDIKDSPAGRWAVSSPLGDLQFTVESVPYVNYRMSHESPLLRAPNPSTLLLPSETKAYTSTSASPQDVPTRETAQLPTQNQMLLRRRQTRMNTSPIGFSKQREPLESLPDMQTLPFPDIFKAPETNFTMDNMTPVFNHTIQSRPSFEFHDINAAFQGDQHFSLVNPEGDRPRRDSADSTDSKSSFESANTGISPTGVTDYAVISPLDRKSAAHDNEKILMSWNMKGVFEGEEAVDAKKTVRGTGEHHADSWIESFYFGKVELGSDQSVDKWPLESALESVYTELDAHASSDISDIEATFISGGPPPSRVIDFTQFGFNNGITSRKINPGEAAELP